MKPFSQLVFLIIILVSITLITRKDNAPSIETGQLSARVSTSFSDVQESLRNMTPEQSAELDRKMHENDEEQQAMMREKATKAMEMQVGLVEAIVNVRKKSMTPEEIKSAEDYVDQQKIIMRSMEDGDKFQSASQAIAR